MAQVHFELTTTLNPADVVRVLTDFSPRRAEVWRNIDQDHLKIHEQGEGWADVTEGNALAGGIWERNRYEWGKEPGHVTVKTLDSNVWTPGDGWEYWITPAGKSGSDISVDVKRHGRGTKGSLIGVVIGLFGSRMLRDDMRRVLAPLEHQ